MRRDFDSSTRLNRLAMLTLAVLLVAGVVFLMTWDIPPPTASVERSIADDRFPQ